jgi:hypothetical protein
MEKIQLEKIVTKAGEKNFPNWEAYRPMTYKVTGNWSLDSATRQTIEVLTLRLKRRNQSEFVNELLIRGLKDLANESN